MACTIRLVSIVAVMAALAAGMATAQDTWNGSSTDWNTPGNWNPFGVPNATNVAVTFTDISAGTVNISSTVSVQSLSFNNPTSSYNLTSSANLTLTVTSAITMNAGPSSIDQINLASISTGSLVFPSGNSLPIANNTTNGGSLVIGPNTVIGTPGSGGVIFGGFASTFLSGSFAASPNNVVGGLTKNGPGLLDYSGSGANLGGNLTLNGGTLNLDYNPNTASKLSGFITLDGGVLLFTSHPVTTVAQTVLGTSVAAGQTDVRGGGIGTVTFNAAGITHTTGGTVDFVPSASGPTFAIQTSTTNTNGLLGAGPAFATVNGGSNWAAQSGVVVAGLAGFSTNIYTSGANTDVTATASPSTFTTNSLRFNANNINGTFLTLSGTNTLQSGGILVTPSFSGGQIQGGTLTAPGSGELLIHVYSNNGITVTSSLVSTAGLTKTGPDLLTLAGNNAGLTGPINVNRGGIDVQATAAVNSASAINFNDIRPGNQLQTLFVDLGNGVNGTISPPIRVSAFSATDYGTYFSTGFSTGSTVTLSGVVSSATGQTTPVRFTGSQSNNSGFNLTNTNTFTGNVSLFQGFLGINTNASLGNATNALFLEVGDNVNGGLIFLNTGITVARPVTLSFNTRIVSNGTDSNTISGPISGSGALVKDGTGTLTISNPGNSFTGGAVVSAGTLALGANSSLPAGTNITVAAAATFTPGTFAINNAINTVTLFGGTFRVSAGTGQLYLVNQIVTGPSGGTVDFTGAGTDTFALNGAGAAITVNGTSTWLSPGNASNISNLAQAVTPITIAPGVTLTNDIALTTQTSFGFRVTGGGTLFQNSDATNVLSMSAPVTVTQGRFRVTDASSNGGVGNLGTGTFALDGGTFAYGGATAATTKQINLTSNGGTIQVESAATTLTANGTIFGPGGLTKIGPGTLVLGNSVDTFTSLTVNTGTVQTVLDNTLGTGAVNVAAAGTLLYTGSTSTARTFNLNFGTLEVGSGATLTLNGAAVNGGFMRGPGAFAVTGGTALSGITTSGSTVINQTGAGSFINFSNGGALTVAAGLAAPSNFTVFTNQGSAAITLTATSKVNVADFQSYGLVTLNPAVVGSGQLTLLANTGTSPMFFNGGSRTFIGTPATATASPAVAGVDLHGQNLVVAGGLFVNNGFVADSTGTPGSVIVDFGALYKGAGTNFVNVITQNGGKVQAGNSPGTMGFGRFVFGPGGVNNYVFAIDDATGTAGPSPDALGHVSGWGLVNAVKAQFGTTTSSGDFVWTATPNGKLTIAIDTLVNPTTVGADVAGPMDHFNPNNAYSWPAANWAGSYFGPADAAALDGATSFDTSAFLNPVAGTFGWALDVPDHTLSLTYTPTAVPEPGTLALAGAAAIAWGTFRRRWASYAGCLTPPQSCRRSPTVPPTWSLWAMSCCPESTCATSQ
jgi:fibronectin-binding autotransporter adhesin